MRTIAVHRVYDVEEETMYAQQVAVIDAQGYVTKVFPLTEEVGQTEWRGGLLILSPIKPADILPDETFLHYKSRIALPTCTERGTNRKRAYLLTPFNVANMEFTPSTRIVLC